MKNSVIICLLIFGYIQSYAQDESTINDRDWLIEVEPSAFFLKGFGVQFGRNLTKDNKLSTSIYSVATDVPEALKKRMFANTVTADHLRVAFQIALNTRYKIEIFKNRASNPYVGLITGWEYFNLTNSVKSDLRIDVFLLTPYLGAEIFLFKKMLYINPQLRAVVYIDPKYSVANRVEKINSLFLLPQISLGVRF